MIAIRSSSTPIRLRPKLVHPASGWLVLLLLLPVGLAGQEAGQVTLYTAGRLPAAHAQCAAGGGRGLA